MFDCIRRDAKPSERRNANVAAERDHAQAALARAVMREDRAAEQRVLTTLQKLEPSEPRWPHRLGDVLRRTKHGGEAALAYQRASELYAELGSAERALTLTRLARTLDERSGFLELARDAARLARATRAVDGRRPA